MSFKDPLLLLLLPVVLGLVLWWKRTRTPPGLRFPSLALFAGIKPGWKQRILILPFVFRLLAIGLFIVALAGPRSVLEETEYTAEGIDIILAIDASRSLASEDFVLRGKRFNRLEVIKSVVEDFIDARTHDRIGIVAFAGLAYTVSPLTKDYEWLKANLARIDFDLIEDGTAIGSALMSSVIRLQQSEAESKVVILLTDGVNNSGRVHPVEAAKAAKALGIRVYTIGAGTSGYAPYPVKNLFGKTVYQRIKTEIDEDVLKEISRITGAQYFRATDTKSLQDVYKQIDEMEKTEFEEIGYREYHELFVYFVFAALVLLAVELLLNHTVFLRIP